MTKKHNDYSIKIKEILKDKKNIAKKEININSIADISLRNELNDKLDENFSFDEKQSNIIMKNVSEYWIYKPEDVQLTNALTIIKLLMDNEKISSKQFSTWANSFVKNSNLVITDIKNFIQTGIETDYLMMYFHLFDIRRKKFIDELIAKMKLIEEMTKGIKSFSNIFGRFWDLSIHDLYKMDITFIEKLQKILIEKDFILRIAKLLGRLAESSTKYEQTLIKEEIFILSNKKTYYSPENITSIKFGNDISILLKHQLAYRKIKGGDTLFKVNYIEKKLLEIDQKAKLLDEMIIHRKENRLKKDSKGPFILCIDTSGSMHGEPEIIAKAMAMAIVKIANKENRKCYIINFSTGIVEFDATNISKNFQQFYNFLTSSFSGGTDVEPALSTAVKKAKENDYKNGDIIVISDFIINSISSQLKIEIDNVRKKKIRIHALSIGKSQIKENIDFFDNNWVYDGSNESIEKIIKDLNKLEESE